MSNPDENEDYIEGEEEEGEFVLEEDDMIEIGEGEDYAAQEGEEGEAEFELDEGMEGEEDEEDEGEAIVDDSIQVFRGHGKEPVYAVAASHKGDLIASGGGDDRAFMWSASNTQGSEVFKHTDSVVAVAFSSDDQWIASAGMDGIVNVKHVSKDIEMKLDGPGSEIEWIAWHPKHAVILAGSADTTVWMFNVAENGTMMSVFAGHNDSVTCGSFTPNGRRVLTGSLDGTLKLWEPNGAVLLHTFSGHQYHMGGVVSMTFKGGDEPIVATGGSDGSVCTIRLDTKKILSKLIHAEQRLSNQRRAQPRVNEDGQEEEEEEEDDQDECSIETLVFCPTLPWLISGGTDGRVVIWDLSVQAKRSVLVHPDAHAIVRCVFLPQSVKLITACADGKVRKYDARSSSLEKVLSGHRDALLDMALLADGKHVVTASDDGTCRLFNVS